MQRMWIAFTGEKRVFRFCQRISAAPPARGFFHREDFVDNIQKRLKNAPSDWISSTGCHGGDVSPAPPHRVTNAVPAADQSFQQNLRLPPVWMYIPQPGKNIGILAFNGRSDR